MLSNVFVDAFRVDDALAPDAHDDVEGTIDDEAITGHRLGLNGVVVPGNHNIGWPRFLAFVGSPTGLSSVSGCVGRGLIDLLFPPLEVPVDDHVPVVVIGPFLLLAFSRFLDVEGVHLFDDVRWGTPNVGKNRRMVAGGVLGRCGELSWRR